MSHLPNYSANESTIAGLTQLVCLAMLQLHKSINERSSHAVVTKQNGSAWNTLFDDQMMSQVTGPTILAVVAEAIQHGNQNDGSVQNMVKCLKEEPQLLVAITELLRSEVFRCDDLQPMNDAFYLVIYGWLNKACHFFEENNMDDEVE